ncbi:hypothetical protein IJJ46_00555 [Candidatus Saccharibacteria bacterium]|nr:hypothetical protein [Candidatus Saccharibacteria bacterium]MBR1795898.1 hypothetical protein [Candidatus Saccharibacteria bacterium]
MKTLDKLKVSVGAFATVAGGALMAMPASAASMVNPTSRWVNSGTQSSVTGSSSGLMDTLNIILNVALGLIGFVAVVMIIVGGLQYTTSSGDTGKVTKAKNTIMYGVIGLVVALLAFAIVNFVLSNIFS